MKIDKETINNLLLDGKKKGFDVRIKDISYVLLCRYYTDEEVAYRSVFPSGQNIDIDLKLYKNSKEVKFVQAWIEETFPVITQTKKRKKTEDDISFEENKAYMLELKKTTEQAMNNGEIEKKDALKILADISVKLNDKFQVQNDNKEQLVVVNMKYNEICSCGREIFVPTKEQLMEKYGLVEKNKKR